ERLNILEEWVLDVGGLQYPIGDMGAIETYSAVQLFAQTARRVRPMFKLADEAAGVIRICQLVEGMPLGIELAAAWTGALSSTDIVQQLERGLDILESPSRNIPPRHRSMRVALDHSWALLSEDERTIFKRLSVFRGGFTLEAAEAIAGAT